jgi:hypothetical protein
MPQQQHTAPVEYREIPRFVGYRFGDDGSFWSCWTKVRQPGHHAGFAWVMTDQWTRRYGGLVEDGHVIVKPKDADLGRAKCVYLHRLILEAFRGSCPPGLEACHNDGNPANNCITNLRWDSDISNAADAIKHGRIARGERNASAKLKERDIPSIFFLWKSGYTKKRIAKMYCMSDVQICNVINRKTWSHVQV